MEGELEEPGDTNAVAEILVNMLQTERQAQGSPSGLRALMAPLPRSAPVSPPPRRLFGTGGPGGGGSRDQESNRQETPEVDTPPGLEQPAESGRVADSAELATTAVALGRLVSVLDRQAKSPRERLRTIMVKPTLTWPTLGDNDHDVELFVEEFKKSVV